MAIMKNFFKLLSRPVVHLLTELGADLTLKAINGETVLHKIAKNNNFTSESSWLSAFKILMSKLAPETVNFKVLSDSSNSQPVLNSGHVIFLE